MIRILCKRLAMECQCAGMVRDDQHVTRQCVTAKGDSCVKDEHCRGRRISPFCSFLTPLCVSRHCIPCSMLVRTAGRDLAQRTHTNKNP